MMRKVVILFLILLVVGLSAFLLYSHINYSKERDALQGDIRDLDKKAELLQRKYAEQKALAGQLMRTKAMLEGEKRTIQAEVEKLHEQLSAVGQDKKGLLAEITKLKGRTKNLEAKIEELSQKNAKVGAERDEIQSKYLQAVNEHEQEVKHFAAEKKSLENELKGLNRDVERCETKNARLVVITQELMNSYKNKGVMDSIMQNEPFTQVEKVEMENLIQEYQERIEKEELKQKK